MSSIQPGKNNNRVGNTILTFTGKWFWPLDPRPEDIDIVDIAHALANKCRFSGHTKKFYSGAQHSVIVSRICDPKDALWGLLHDASEAYLVDLPKPLKILKEYDWFVEVENKVQRAVSDRFGLDPVQPESTHVADKVSLFTEKRDLMGHNSPNRKWEEENRFEPLEERIIALDPVQSRTLFLARYEELRREIGGNMPAPDYTILLEG